MTDRHLILKKEWVMEKAMELFTTKGYQLTSMQEIAELCGISKGSLYQYYHSKEDLLLSIIKLNFNQARKNLLAIEQDHNLTAKDQFTKQLHMIFEKPNHFKEFMQINSHEAWGSLSPQFFEYVNEIEQELSLYLEKKLAQIYGPDIIPYLVDLSIILKGILLHGLMMTISHQIPADYDRMIHFTLKQVDILAEQMKKDSLPPYITREMWAQHQKCHGGSAFCINSPLSVLNTLRISLSDHSLPPQISDYVIQSIDVLESEWAENQPRKIVLLSMIRNLLSINELNDCYELLTKLQQQAETLS